MVAQKRSLRHGRAQAAYTGKGENVSHSRMTVMADFDEEREAGFERELRDMALSAAAGLAFY